MVAVCEEILGGMGQNADKMRLVKRHYMGRMRAGRVQNVDRKRQNGASA